MRQEQIRLKDRAAPIQGEVMIVGHHVPKDHPRRDYYASLSPDQFMRAFQAGELQDINHQVMRKSNIICEGLYENLIDRMLDNAGVNDSLIVKYIEVGLSRKNPTDAGSGAWRSSPSAGDPYLGESFYRAAPTDSKKIDAATAAWYLFVGLDDGNPSGPYTVNTASGTNDTTNVYVATAHAISEGDIIYVETGQPDSYTLVTGVSGQQLTLDATHPLPATPTNGGHIAIQWAELGLIGNDDATSSPGITGSLFGHLFIDPPFEKNDETIVTIEYRVLMAVS